MLTRPDIHRVFEVLGSGWVQWAQGACAVAGLLLVVSWICIVLRIRSARDTARGTARSYELRLREMEGQVEAARSATHDAQAALVEAEAKAQDLERALECSLAWEGRESGGSQAGGSGE